MEELSVGSVLNRVDAGNVEPDDGLRPHVPWMRPLLCVDACKRLKAMGNPKYQNDGSAGTSGPGFGLTLHQDQLDLPRHWARPRGFRQLDERPVPQGRSARLHPRRLRCHGRYTAAHVSGPDQALEAAGSDCGQAGLVAQYLDGCERRGRRTRSVSTTREVDAAVRFLSAEPLLGPVPSLTLQGFTG